ncbi:hypothetical protein EVAR_8955_1 [Eumeta japonica]|uniref:Uncharacterized protein n=1 Tax=Eumeta variegata TaxID=151549 RepID=A0A4C1U0C8_EUMVA|nr:hypothetical protein EVAR_8955_1 [Eumeta japonica]
MIHGFQMWSLTVSHSNELKIIQRAHATLGVSLHDQIRKRTRVTEIVQEISKGEVVNGYIACRTEREESFCCGDYAMDVAVLKGSRLGEVKAWLRSRVKVVTPPWRRCTPQAYKCEGYMKTLIKDEQVIDFVYLDNANVHNSKDDRDSERRVRERNKANGDLLATTNVKSASRQTRLAIPSRIPISTFMYGSESWLRQKRNEIESMQWRRDICVVCVERF